jgi:hypothetical protein
MLGVFLTTAGANSNVPAVMSYQANNIRGQWKRAFCSATLVGMGGVGGIAGGLIFRYVRSGNDGLHKHANRSRFQDAPSYRPGLYACIACCLLTLIIVGLITLGSWRSNKKADRGEIELEYHGVSFAGNSLAERRLTSEQDGDQKGFRYTY